MSNISKEILRNYVKEQKFKSAMDAIHYKIREDKQIVVKAAYVVLGVNMDGQKEVLGIWIGANEISKCSGSQFLMTLRIGAFKMFSFSVLTA